MGTRRRLVFLTLGLLTGAVGIIAGGMELWNISYLRSLNHTAVAHAGENYGMHQSMPGRLISSKFNSYRSDVWFTTSTGQHVGGFKFLTEEVYLGFQSARPMLVYYDPKNPSNFVLYDEDTQWLAKIFIGIAIAFGSVRYLGRDQKTAN